MSWTALMVLAAGAYAFKLAGLLIGERLGDGPLRHAVQLIPPALFCGLIMLQTFETATELVVDARVVGLVVSVLATLKRVPFAGIIILSVAATAVARLIGG